MWQENRLLHVEQVRTHRACLAPNLQCTCLVLQQTVRSLRRHFDVKCYEMQHEQTHGMSKSLTNLRFPPPPTPLYDCRCVAEQVSLLVTDTELRTLLTDGADFLLKSIWSRNSSVTIVNSPRVGPLWPTDPLFQWVHFPQRKTPTGVLPWGMWPCHEAKPFTLIKY